MHKYVIRRLLLAIPVLLLSSLIVFGLMRVMPGDALTALMAESGNVGERELRKLREDLGLGRPYHEQYLIWLWQLVSLNPGYSIFTNEDRKSTRLNSSHLVISYAVFCLKKKKCKTHSHVSPDNSNHYWNSTPNEVSLLSISSYYPPPSRIVLLTFIANSSLVIL